MNFDLVDATTTSLLLLLFSLTAGSGLGGGGGRGGGFCLSGGRGGVCAGGVPGVGVGSFKIKQRLD